MNVSWGAAHKGERHSVPVEMRFIDMFMAALGALIFMAMLLAFLLRFVPHQSATVESAVGAGKSRAAELSLLTRTLPPARVGEPYELAFAYRGGIGDIVWEIPAGSQELRAGMQFDSVRGVISGTPAAAGVMRFVLRVHDSGKGLAEHPFELLIEPSRKSSHQVEKWLAISILSVLIIVWLVGLASIAQFSVTLAYLKQAWARGERQVEVKTGLGTKEVIDLPDGIPTYESRAKAAKKFSLYLFLVIIVLVGWLVWRLRIG